MRVKVPKRAALKPRKRKPDDPAQFKRFVEAARHAGVDESPDALDKAFDKVIRPALPSRRHD
jgi:hypothetical protein